MTGANHPEAHCLPRHLDGCIPFFFSKLGFTRALQRLLRVRVALVLVLAWALAAEAGAEERNRFEGGDAGFQFRILGGKAFAGDGKHGGGGFGGTASFQTGGWVMGAEFLVIGEPSGLKGIDRLHPLEDYRLLGAFAGRQWKTEGGMFTGGLGAGWLQGLRRTDLQRVALECKGRSLFDCPEEDRATVEYYGSRRFATPGLNPLVAAEARMGRVAAGVWAQAFINAEQGLGLIALVLRFGS